MQIYRAVSQAELDDIISAGQFRPNPHSFIFGKWFALRPDAAEAWGRWFAKRDGHRYYVVETVVPEAIASMLTVVLNLDNIGEAVILEDEQLSLLPISLLPPVPIVA